MKRYFFIAAVIALFAFAGNVQAQNQGTNRCKYTPEQRIDFKVTRMQNRLMLDEATAKEFAPIYKEYLTALAECCPKQGKACQKSACNLTDEQIKQNIENCISADAKRAEVREKYYKKLSKVLTARQLQVVFCRKGARCGAGRMCAPHWGKGKNRVRNVANGRRGNWRCDGGKAANCSLRNAAESK